MNEWITSIQPPVLMKMRYKMRCKSGGGASSTPAAEKSTKGSPSLEREGALRLVGANLLACTVTTRAARRGWPTTTTVDLNLKSG